MLTQLGNSFSAAVGETDTSIVAKAKHEDNVKILFFFFTFYIKLRSVLKKNNCIYFFHQTSDKKYLGAPYVLHNCTGLTAKLTLQNNDDFSVFLTEEYTASDYRYTMFCTILFIY